MTHYFQSKLPKYDIRSAQQKRIRRAMVNFIIKKAMPLTLVEEKEFREMVEQLDIRFNHLTRYGNESTILNYSLFSICYHSEYLYMDVVW